MAYVSATDLAAMIKAKLDKKDKTQRALAVELGISEAYLSDFLNGRRGAGPAILKRLGFEPTPYYRKAKEAEPV